MEFKWYDWVGIMGILLLFLTTVGMWHTKMPTSGWIPLIVLASLFDQLTQVYYRTKATRLLQEIVFLSTQVGAYEERLAGYNK